MSTKCLADSPGGSPFRVRRGEHARETHDVGTYASIRLVFEYNRKVTGHGYDDPFMPASFKIRFKSPIPTSFFVCTAMVTTRFVDGFQNCR
jgi:hypothetical protein